MSVAGGGSTVLGMEHVRTSALKSVVRILEGIPGVKAVRPTRRLPYENSALPAIDVSWAQEEAGTEVRAGRTGQRMMDRDMVLRVRVVAYDEDTDGPIEFQLDAIQLEIETRLAANQLLPTEAGRPTTRRVKLRRTVSDDSTKGTRTFVATAVFFQVTASHREGRPDITLPQA